MTGPAYFSSSPAAMLLSSEAFAPVCRQEQLDPEKVIEMLLRKQCSKSLQFPDAVKHVKPKFNSYDFSRANSMLAFISKLGGESLPAEASQEEAPEAAINPQEL